MVVVNRWSNLACLAFFLLLAGCSSGGNYAPVVETQAAAKAKPSKHVVKHGETLFSIAWRYGMDFRGLAATNNIRSPYTIYPGQTIVLTAVKPAPIAPRPAAAPKPTSPPPTAARSIAPTSTQRPSTPATKAPATVPNSVSNTVSTRWHWPASGAVTQGFRATAPVHKGIDIYGKLGEPVYAANGGKVVYAGSGLVGYGNLLILKHSDSYLSAYAHNHRLLVKEGDWIKVGARIAEMGDSGTDRVKLHFEIRHDGKPVDPIRILPKR